MVLNGHVGYGFARLSVPTVSCWMSLLVRSRTTYNFLGLFHRHSLNYHCMQVLAVRWAYSGKVFLARRITSSISPNPNHMIVAIAVA